MTVPSRIEADFKRGMRRLTSTITILTTAEGDAWHGMTATSVCSVCAQPPSLLACIARSASLHAPTVNVRRFCVNLLRTHHGELVSTFSGKLVGAARFETADWRIDHRGLPYLADAQAVFFCTVDRSIDYGDHEIFIARVDDVQVEEEIAPLLYQDGRLHSSRPLGE
jgi:flavin reductase (DIM6/NTAB) family NADH-FMN oxidoreductase RutF